MDQECWEAVENNTVKGDERMGTYLIKIKEYESAFLDLRKVEIISQKNGYREFELIIGDRIYTPCSDDDKRLIVRYINEL